MPRIDVHVHVAACTPGHGRVSPRMARAPSFLLLRLLLGLRGRVDGRLERTLAHRLLCALDAAAELDAAVVLAFDAVHDRDGRPDWANTHLYVSNDYVMDLARRSAKALFGASIHPYRRDALAELERCIGNGAVLVKWLPLTQGIDLADPRCIRFYEAMAHWRIPLLCHTGGERTLTHIDRRTDDPAALVEPLQRGVTVIAAHCGTRSAPFEQDYVQQFIRMAGQYENLYGDTAALSLPTRWHAYTELLRHPHVRRKLVHGSDWPIPPIPPPHLVGLAASASFLGEGNAFRRDIAIKRCLGLDESHFTRAADLLRR